MTDETEQVAVVSSPGRILSEARTRAGKSAAEIAESMNLKPQVIEAIDADDFASLPNVTFTRGYLKAYARAVGCEQKDVLTAYEQLCGAPTEEPLDMQSFSRRTSRERSNSRIMWITYFIALLLVASVVIWWWQKFQDQAEVTLPDSSAQIEAVSPTVPQESSEELNGAQQSVEPIVEQPVAEPVTEVESITTANVVESNAEKLLSVADRAIENSPPGSDVIDEVIPESQPLAQEETAAEGEAVISMTFSADCWIKVEDALGEVVAEGVKTSARVVTFSGRPPFKAVLGAPGAVTIEYQGKPMAFVVKNPKRSLTLTLPITE